MVRTKLFWRFLASYFILAFCILSFAGVFLSTTVVARMRNDLDSLILGNVRTMRDFLEARMTEMDRIAYEIDNDVDFKAYRLYTDGYNRMRAAKRLDSYRSANTYLLEIAFCYSREVAAIYNGEQTVLTAGGTFTQDTFGNYFYPFDTGLREEFFKGVPQGEQARFRSVMLAERAGPGREQYVYMVPLGAFNQRGMLLFLIDKKSVDSIIAPALAETGGRLIVLDGAGEVLIRLGEGDWPEGDVKRIAVDSENRGWQYFLEIPTTSYNANLRGHILGYFVWIFPVAPMGFVLAYLLSMQNYRPIGRMLDAYAKSGGRTDVSLLGVATALEEMDAANAELKAQLRRQAALSRMQLTFNLLHGRYRSREPMLEDMRQNGMVFHYPRLAVLTVHAAPPPDKARVSHEIMPRLFADVEAFFSDKGVPCWGVADGHGEALAFILNIKDGAFMNRLEAEFSSLADQYLLQGARLTAGVGSVCDDPMEICDSYVRATDAASFRFVDTGRTTFFDAPTEQSDERALDWFLERRNALAQLLTEGKWREADAEIGFVKENIKSRRTPPDIAKSILLETTASVQMAYGARNLTPDARAQGLLERLWAVRRHTVDEYIDDLTEVCRRLREQTEELRQNKSYLLKEEVDRYLAEHYDQGDLTLTSIAEYFDVSPGHLTRYYKKYSGTTLMQRLNTIRLAHARELLVESDLSLNGIMQKCGFADKNNFISKFKRQYHVPPITYRSMNRERTNEANKEEPNDLA